MNEPTLIYIIMMLEARRISEADVAMPEATSPERELDEDQKVIWECQKGPEHCGAFYRHYLPIATRKAKGYTHDNVKAKELAHAVLTKLIEKSIRSYRFDGAPFDAWLERVIRNAYRSVGREELSTAAHEDIIESVGEVGEAQVVHHVQSPEQLAERRQLWEKMSAALTGLSALQREALLLFEVEGLSYEEIAKRQGVAEGTIMSRLSKARAAAREVLGPLYEELQEEKVA